ncbi:MAG: hypothetical protein ACO1RX_17340 [Candidatus Sericytochromatia bacterium]
MILFDGFNLPFLCMIAAAFVFLGLQFVGADHDGDSTGDLPWLGFVNLGRIPLSLLLMVGLFSWGSLGLILNLLGRARLPASPLFGIALGLGAVGAVLLTRISSQALGGLFRETSAAIRPEELVGCVGTVISGALTAETEASGRTQPFGRVHVYSAHGTLLQIPCLTHPGCAPPAKGAVVFVTGYDPQHKLYSVLSYESDDYVAYLHGYAGDMARFEQRLQKSLDTRQQHLPASHPNTRSF